MWLEKFVISPDDSREEDKKGFNRFCEIQGGYNGTIS